MFKFASVFLLLSFSFAAHASITRTYPVTSGDCGSIIVAAGNSYYPVIFSDPTGYPANCQVQITNADTARGKAICLNVSPCPNGLVPFVLWPGQTVTISNATGRWLPNPAFQRWRLPVGETVLNVDPTHAAAQMNGGTAYPVGDGLGLGADALPSIEAGAYYAENYIDDGSLPVSSPPNNSTVRVLLCAGCTDTKTIHYSPHGLVGAHGGAALIIDGNGGTLATSGSSIEIYLAGMVQIRNITLKSVLGDCIDAEWGAKVAIEDLVTFGPCGMGHMSVTDAARIQIDHDYEISDSAQYHMVNSGGYIRMVPGVHGIVTANLAFTDFVLGTYGGSTVINDFNTNGFIVTGRQYEVYYNATIADGGHGALLPGMPGAIPGNTPGTTGDLRFGGQAW